MGITAFDIELLDRTIDKYKPKTVVELGAQNLYNQPLIPAPYANIYYQSKGVMYRCIDLNGENGADKIDLSSQFDVIYGVDLVTDFGTNEHVTKPNEGFSWEAIYNCWVNKHNLLKVGGVMISENPKDGHWELHGYSYYTEDFYRELVLMCNYEIIELGTVCAMGNCETGQNIYCVMQKQSELFPTLEQFKTLPLKSREQQIKIISDCNNGHAVGLEQYDITKIEFDGKICNCGKFKFVAESCGCSEPHLELKMYENN